MGDVTMGDLGAAGTAEGDPTPLSALWPLGLLAVPLLLARALDRGGDS